MDEGKSKIRYNLRSSLKKSSRNPLGSLDISDEGEDITLPPPPRRVSFAASSTVKPFVNDPEKNTIWDNTYEEEINHTDSNNVLSLDSHSNIQEIQKVNINFNQSLINLEDTSKNFGKGHVQLTNCFPSQVKSIAEESMELTCQWKNNIIDNNKVFANCTQVQEVDMSLTNCGLAIIANKENIHLPITCASHYVQQSHDVKKTLQRQKIIEPFADKSLMSKTVKDPLDMELTCKFNSEPEEPMEVDETVKTKVQTYENCSIYQECDMSMTCKFSNDIIRKNTVFPRDKNCMNMQNASDMELTCKFPPKNVSCVKNQQTITKDIISTHSSSGQCVDDMEFALKSSNLNRTEGDCQFPDKATNLPKVERNVGIKSSNISQADMEFTCQFSDKSNNMQKVLRNVCIKSSNINQTEADMDITCQFSEKPILQKTAKLNGTTGFPPKAVEDKSKMSNISEAKHVDVDQSSVDMEFTCKFPQNIMAQIGSNEILSQNVASVPREQTKANLSTSQIPHKSDYLQQNVTNKLLKTCQLNTDIEFTCILPREVIESQNILQDMSSGANKSTVTVVSSHLGLSNVNHSVDDKKQAYHCSQDKANTFMMVSTDADCGLSKTPLKSIDIYTDDSTNKENVGYLTQTLNSQETVKRNIVQEKLQQDSQSVNKENVYSVQELNKNRHNHSSFNMNFTSKTLLIENSLAEKYNEINSIAHTSSVRKPKLQMEDTINVSLPELHLEPKNDNCKGPKLKVIELPDIPVATDCTDHSTKARVSSSVDIQNESHAIPIMRANLNLPEQTIFVLKDDTLPITEIIETNKDISFSKDFNKNETISAEECSLIDTLTSILDEDLPDNNLGRGGNNEHAIVRREVCTTPNLPKVIYSEPMKAVKPSTSMLDFSNGLSSGKKPFNFSSLTSMDGTQQLIEATFSKLTGNPNEPVNDSLLKNESGLGVINNTIDEHRLAQNSLDRNSSFNTSSVRVQIILDNIQHKIVKYEKPQFDFEECHRLLEENQNLLDKVKYHLENCHSPESQSSSLDEQVRKLSLANSSYNYSNISDSISEDADDDINNGCVAINVPKTFNERILEVFNTVEEHILKLQYNEKTYYIFSAFSQGAWFAVDFHPGDGRVLGIKTIVGLKNDSTSLYSSVHKFVVDCICKKLEMCNLKSSLGSCFDVLSLLDHVIIITESALEFCMEFIDANRQYKTLKMEPDGQVSFQILVTYPPIWWTVQFKMASIENIDQNSLEATSKYGIINEDHLKTVLRNTEPGLDCIRRFVGGVKDYFDRTQLRKLKS